MELRGIDFRVWLLCLVALFPVLRMAHVSWLIAIWGTASLIWALARERPELRLRLRIRWATWLFVSGLLVIYALSLLYSENLEAGLEKISQGASLVVFPLVLFIVNPPVTRKGWQLIGATFLLACAGQALMMNYHFFVSSGLEFPWASDSFNNLPFRSAAYEAGYGEYHPTYVALWYAFGMYLALEFGQSGRRTMRWLVYPVFVLLGVTVLLLASRIGAIGAALSVFLFIVQRTKGRWKWVFLAGLIVFSGLAVALVPSIRARFVREFQVTEWAPPVGARHNSVNLRIGTYLCAAELFAANPLAGVGIGDVQDALDGCYSGYDTNAYALRNYNTHNFYFHVLLACGLPGLLYFLFFLYRCLALAFRSAGKTYQVLLILCMTFMLFENLLSRFHGVLFFAIFNSVFISLHLRHADRLLGSVPQSDR